MTLVIFSINDILYSVDVGHVEEVIPLPAITPLANLPSFVFGIIYLRGKTVPIIDLRKRLGYADCPLEPDNDIIVTKVHGKIAGLIVDKVQSVVDIQDALLIAPPDMLEGIDNRYMSAITQMGQELIILLNLEKILTISENDKLLKLDIQHQNI